MTDRRPRRTCINTRTANQLLDRCPQVHLEENVFKCVVCNQCFSQKDELTRHKKDHKRRKKTKMTDRRPRRINTRTANQLLDRCPQVRLEEKVFKCVVCNQCFSQKDDLTRHTKDHKRRKKVSCHLNEKKSLPVQTIDSTKKTKYSCEICGRAFYNKINLSRHFNIHTGDKPFQCGICNKTYTLKCDLIKHLYVHTGEKFFRCEICDKEFIRRSGLTKHMGVHTGTKPFKCEFCGKVFSWNTDLLRHVNIHTGEKCHRCKICDKTFSRKHTLEDHSRIHTGEMPFHCPFCNKGFISTQNRRNHLKICECKSIKVESC